MPNNIEFDQRIEQKLSINPRMIQRINLLSTTSAELGEMIANELDNNPALEEDNLEIEKELENLPSDLENYANQYDDDYREKTISKKINLYDFLEKQVGELKVPDEKRKLLTELIHHIDESGYFPPDFNTFEIAKKIDLSTEVLEDSIKILQDLEPTGVAARNLTECLSIQIDHLEINVHSSKTIRIAKRLIKDNLQKLKRKTTNSLAKEFKEPEKEIQKSIDLIKNLKITPAEEFITYDEELKIPDILVSIKDKIMKVELNEEKFKNDGIRPLVCSQEYIELSTKLGELNTTDQKHIKEKLDQAKKFIENVKNWKETLLKVGLVIAKKQKEYFQFGIQNIKPMKLRDVSNETHLHISTISRTIKGKFLETPSNEVLSLKYFFHNSLQNVHGEEISSRYIQDKIQEFVNSEDKTKPLSDEKIKKILIEIGISISRRTVSKYRENLKILSSPKRIEKKY